MDRSLLRLPAEGDDMEATMRRKRWARAVLPLLCAASMAVGCGGGDPGESVLPGVDALVFVKRAFVTDSGEHSVTGGNSQTIDYLRYVPGGGTSGRSGPGH